MDNDTDSCADTQFSGGCLTVYVHISGGMIPAACIQNRLFLPLLIGRIFNVNFFENEIVAYDENVIVALSYDMQQRGNLP